MMHDDETCGRNALFVPPLECVRLMASFASGSGDGSLFSAHQGRWTLDALRGASKRWESCAKVWRCARCACSAWRRAFDACDSALVAASRVSPRLLRALETAAVARLDGALCVDALAAVLASRCDAQRAVAWLRLDALDNWTALRTAAQLATFARERTDQSSSRSFALECRLLECDATVAAALGKALAACGFSHVSFGARDARELQRYESGQILACPSSFAALARALLAHAPRETRSVEFARGHSGRAFAAEDLDEIAAALSEDADGSQQRFEQLKISALAEDRPRSTCSEEEGSSSWESSSDDDDDDEALSEEDEGSVSSRRSSSCESCDEQAPAARALTATFARSPGTCLRALATLELFDTPLMATELAALIAAAGDGALPTPVAPRLIDGMYRLAFRFGRRKKKKLGSRLLSEFLQTIERVERTRTYFRAVFTSRIVLTPRHQSTTSLFFKPR